MADDAAPLLPELARSLRVLGTPRDAAAEAAHAAVFGPLLGARARASKGDAAAALAALRGRELMARIESLARAAAEAAPGLDAARARARVAETAEILDPLRAAFVELDRLGAGATPAAAASPEWERWVAQLRQVFAAADVACGALATLLASGDDAPARRWFGGARGGPSR